MFSSIFVGKINGLLHIFCNEHIRVFGEGRLKDLLSGKRIILPVYDLADLLCYFLYWGNEHSG